MPRIGPPACAVLCLLFALPPKPSAAADCPVPPDIFLFEPTLPHLVDSLVSGKPVTIVAIGGASTEGRAAEGAEHSWPSRLGVELSRDFPQATVTVVNLARLRQTSAAVARRLEKEVITKNPSLVIWETGTVDAVRKVELGEFQDTLQSAVALLKRNSEVVLMDMQFSRGVQSFVDFEPYRKVLQQVSDLNDIPLFPRTELMREWSETGEIDYRVKDKQQRRDMARKLYRCIGAAVAVFLTRGTPPPEAGR
jgi:hypothetical protein